MTQEEMAAGLGINTKTLKNWRDAHPEFAEALAAGKEAVDNKVERALYARATGYSHEAVKIMAIGGKVKQVPYVEHYPPEPTSMAFWLKNRRPKDWRDRQEIEHSGSIEPVQDMTPEERRALIAGLLAKRNADKS